MSGAIYLVSTLLIIVYGSLFLPKVTNDKTKKKLLYFSFFVIVLLLGCRHPFESPSSDVTNYYNMLKRAIESDTWATYTKYYGVEKGYLLLNWVLSRFIHWPQAILFIHAIICCYFTFKFIYRYSDDVLLTIICFIAFGAFLFYSTAFRQSIAISICLSSVKFAEKKKPIMFLITVLIASTIHQTAIVFLPVYFLIQFKASKLTAFADVFLVVILAMFSEELVGIGNEMFDMNYGGVEYSGSLLGGMVNLIISIVVAVIMYLGMPDSYFNKKYMRRIRHNEKDLLDIEQINYQFFHVLLVGISIYAMRFTYLALERVSFYFFTPMIYVLFPQVINKYLKKGEDSSIRMLIYMCMLFLIFWRYRDIDYVPFWS